MRVIARSHPAHHSGEDRGCAGAWQGDGVKQSVQIELVLGDGEDQGEGHSSARDRGEERNLRTFRDDRLVKAILVIDRGQAMLEKVLRAQGRVALDEAFSTARWSIRLNFQFR
jgi:hypothetical protein